MHLSIVFEQINIGKITKLSQTRLQTGLESGVLAAKRTAFLLPNSEHRKSSAAIRVTIATAPNSKLIKLTKGIHWATASFLSAHTTLHVWAVGKAGQI